MRLTYRALLDCLREKVVAMCAWMKRDRTTPLSSW
jgi:hypothetical protein